jgi:hypothetical protein
VSTTRAHVNGGFRGEGRGVGRDPPQR